MTFSCFQTTVDDGVAHLRMCRPDRLNSMNEEFWTELPSALDGLESDEAVRVIVLSAEGNHFSSGMDLSVFEDDTLLNTSGAPDRERLRRLVLSLQDAFSRLERCRVPVVAAIQGACIGAGLDMATACDIRYATVSAFFCIQEINIGIMADLGSLQRLPRLIPEGAVRELAYTGDRLGADRARHLGLVNDLFDTTDALMHHTFSVARKIAAQSPLAVTGTKEAITYARDHSVPEALYQAANWQSGMFDPIDVKRRVRARMQKQGRDLSCPPGNVRNAAPD